MESAMIFPPGAYYIGDPGFVLPNDDLRMLFSQLMQGILRSGSREFVASRGVYWFGVTPSKAGTFFDNDNKGWSFDWGCFGVVPWERIECRGSYEANKIEFTEPFECLSTRDSITIGHLHFTLNPK